MSIICFTRYDPQFMKELIYRILRLPDMSEDIKIRSEWIKKSGSDCQIKQEEAEERVFAALCLDRTENVILALKTSTELKMLEDTQKYLHENLPYLPEAYRAILEELCTRRLTWRYLRMTKYLSDRKIKRLRDEAVEAFFDMIKQIPDEPEKGN